MSGKNQSFPEMFEPAGGQLGVAHRVLNVAVTEVGLQRQLSCVAKATSAMT
jgi:hypothetical protein